MAIMATDPQTLDLLQQVAGWGAGIVALVSSGALLRRKLSRDHVELTKDRAESAIVNLLLKERDEGQVAVRDAQANMREAWKERHADAEAIARLTAENAYQAAEIARLSAEMESFKRVLARLYPDTRQFLDSNYFLPSR